MPLDLAPSSHDQDEHDPLARPAWACVLHAPPKRVGAWIAADAGYVTCSTCDTALRERLDDVGRRYLQLDSRPGAQGGYGSRGAPGFGSRPPCSLHVASLRDTRSSADAHVWIAGDGRVHRESTRPPLSVHGVLSCQAWAVAEHRGMPGPHDREDVHGLLRFLGRHISYITRHAELVLELDAAARDLQGQLRPVTGDARRRIGTCPAAVESPGIPDTCCGHCGCDSSQHDNDGTGVDRRCNVTWCDCSGFSPRNPDGLAGVSADADPVRCDAPLYAPVNGADTIRCGACGAVWERADWLRLGDLLMHAETVESVAGEDARGQNSSAA